MDAPPHVSDKNKRFGEDLGSEDNTPEGSILTSSRPPSLPDLGLDLASQRSNAKEASQKPPASGSHTSSQQQSPLLSPRPTAPLPPPFDTSSRGSAVSTPMRTSPVRNIAPSKSPLAASRSDHNSQIESSQSSPYPNIQPKEEQESSVDVDKLTQALTDATILEIQRDRQTDDLGYPTGSGTEEEDDEDWDAGRIRVRGQNLPFVDRTTISSTQATVGQSNVAGITSSSESGQGARASPGLKEDTRGEEQASRSAGVKFAEEDEILRGRTPNSALSTPHTGRPASAKDAGGRAGPPTFSPSPLPVEDRDRDRDRDLDRDQDLGRDRELPSDAEFVDEDEEAPAGPKKGGQAFSASDNKREEVGHESEEGEDILMNRGTKFHTMRRGELVASPLDGEEEEDEDQEGAVGGAEGGENEFEARIEQEPVTEPGDSDAAEKRKIANEERKRKLLRLRLERVKSASILGGQRPPPESLDAWGEQVDADEKEGSKLPSVNVNRGAGPRPGSGYVSPYAQSAELKRVLEQRRLRDKQRDEEDRKRSAQEQKSKRAELDSAFKQWWKDKEEKKREDERKAQEREQQEAKKREAEEREKRKDWKTFSQWRQGIHRREKAERRLRLFELEEQRTLEREQSVQNKEEAQTAFKKWIRKKRLEAEREQQAEIERQQFMRALLRATKQNKELNAAVLMQERAGDYYGYRF